MYKKALESNQRPSFRTVTGIPHNYLAGLQKRLNNYFAGNF
jgi:hypothetical protein